jgi:hypothetical protein
LFDDKADDDGDDVFLFDEALKRLPDLRCLLKDRVFKLLHVLGQDMEKGTFLLGQKLRLKMRQIFPNLGVPARKIFWGCAIHDFSLQTTGRRRVWRYLGDVLGSTE